ncbi:MAG: efflux RND transporter periplasmic adaptor subunit [Acidobacteriota bacterium]
MRSTALLLIALLLAAGCGGTNAAPAVAAKTEAQKANKVSADGMCLEHGVLEAICTKCNPALIPVFQAKKDWCAEHGFPESVCPICHPERGGRPQADVSMPTDEGPAEGTLVKFRTKETRRLAGIETARANNVEHGASIPATATVVYDGTKVAAVNARSAGVVTSIRADIGERVAAGAALAEIESASVAEDTSRHQAAKGRVAAAEATWKRQKELEESGVAPMKDVIEAQRVLDEARAELAAAQAALRLVGSPSASSASYVVRTPIAGVVTHRHPTIGSLVDSGEPLFEVVDTASMWAELDILEKDLALVAVGQEVTLELANVPERSWSGAIQFIAPSVDPKTRTAKARVRVENPDGILRANMYGSARISIGSDRQVVVPASAIQVAKGVPVAFVKKSDEEYETRRVRTVTRDGDVVVLASGVRAGEEVVTTGSFFLMTETLKDSIGAGCCDVD